MAGVVDLEMARRLHVSNDAMVELLGGTIAHVPERYAVASSAAMLPLGISPVLIPGTSDDSVPIEVNQTYAKAARSLHNPVTEIELEGVDHFDVIDPHSDAWAVPLNE